MSGVDDLAITTVVILGTAGVWLIWDVFLYLGDKETISVKINRWSTHMGAIIFLVGFLCGHWFW